MNEYLHFGKVDKPLPDWRKILLPDDDNDEDLLVSEDVKIILGFDPDEELTE